MYEVLSFFEKGVLLVVMLTAPPILAAVISGVTVSLIQSIFQIQDQTLPFAVKLVAVGAALYFSARWVGGELLALASQSLALIPSL